MASSKSIVNIAVQTPKTAANPLAVCNENIRVLGTADYKSAAASLADAFATDAVARYFVDAPDTLHWSDEKKWATHVHILEVFSYVYGRAGLATSIGENNGCVALWHTPNSTTDDWITYFLSGYWRLPYALSTECKTRLFTEFFPLLEQTKSAILGSRDHDSYYLVYIGTRPSARGKGYARRTLEYVTNRADAEGRCCYLESSNAANLAFYRRMGFEVAKTIKLERAGLGNEVVLDIMVREPIPVLRKTIMPVPQQTRAFMEPGIVSQTDTDKGKDNEQLITSIARASNNKAAAFASARLAEVPHANPVVL